MFNRIVNTFDIILIFRIVNLCHIDKGTALSPYVLNEVIRHIVTYSARFLHMDVSQVNGYR